MQLTALHGNSPLAEVSFQGRFGQPPVGHQSVQQGNIIPNNTATEPLHDKTGSTLLPVSTSPTGQN